ncbi:MAG: hypothetical protein ACI4UK_06980 [Floccifex sp.]
MTSKRFKNEAAIIESAKIYAEILFLIALSEKLIIIKLETMRAIIVIVEKI